MVTFPVVVTAALLDSMNPCAISVLLISLGFVAGLGYSSKSVRAIGIAYVCGAYLGYLFIGLGVLKALTMVAVPNLFARLAAALFVLSGILEFVKLKFPSLRIFKIPRSSHAYLARFMQKGSMPASFMTGILVALFEFPCTGGPYFSILALLREQQTFTSGLGYLVIYNAVFVLPLMAIVALAGNQGLTKAVQDWKQRHAQLFSVVSGIAFVALGITLFLFT